MVDAVIRRPFLPVFAVPYLMLRWFEVRFAHPRKVNPYALIMGLTTSSFPGEPCSPTTR